MQFQRYPSTSAVQQAFVCRASAWIVLTSASSVMLYTFVSTVLWPGIMAGPGRDLDRSPAQVGRRKGGRDRGQTDIRRCAGYSSKTDGANTITGRLDLHPPS